jgi:predicted tellurium resistance membrane protein TerC
MDLSHLLTADNLAALLTLTGLEIVLGIDNIVFIAILVGRLPEKDRPKARFIGLSLAMLMRIGLLFSISWVMSLTKPLFEITFPLGHTFSGKDLVLLIGGLFLVCKATLEIHHKVEGAGEGVHAPHLPGDTHDKGAAPVKAPKVARLFPILIQIMLLDIVFSLDSVITAVGMAKNITIMVTAVVIAVGVMLIFSGHVSRLIEKHPTLKMLALSFLILIGVMLTAEGFHQHIEKGYIYFAMAFSLGVELLNIWVRARSIGKAARA